jgi:hypothetical protein
MLGAAVLAVAPSVRRVGAHMTACVLLLIADALLAHTQHIGVRSHTVCCPQCNPLHSQWPSRYSVLACVTMWGRGRRTSTPTMLWSGVTTEVSPLNYQLFFVVLT